MKAITRTWIAALIVISTALGTSPAPAEAKTSPDQEFTIAVGETLTFDADEISRVATGNNAVADTQTSRDNRFLFIIGRSPGVSTINLFMEGDDRQTTLLIRVVGINPASLAREVQQVLGDGAGVDVRVVNGRVLIEGEVSNQVFQQKIDELTELYPDQVLNFATYREAFVEGARMVAIEVYFIQMATTERDSLGVAWDQFIGFNFSAGTGDVPLYYTRNELGSGVSPESGQSLLPRPISLTGGRGITGYSSLVGNLNFALDFMVEQGLIKTIQQGTLVTEAGTAAEYHSGGTLLIPTATKSTAGYQERPFGFQVEITPILDFQNRVKLEIDMSYSEVDFSAGIGELPGLRSNHVTSTVNMMEGQSVLISAQANMDTSSNQRGFSMLGRVPLLGWLFKSRNLLHREMNNALFITPRVYEPGARYHRTLVQGVFQDLVDAGVDSGDLPRLYDVEKMKN